MENVLILKVMFGVAEYAAYITANEATEKHVQTKAPEIEPLPPEYYPVTFDPVTHSGAHSATDDFILVAEFSEIEGPKPLITIPKDVDITFDLNEFTVRIMAVDYQTLGCDSFRLGEDTEVIMTEGSLAVSAYVHHFTLSDSQARGFVRPFCMAYVTTNHRKLNRFYEELSTEFSKVSKYFKYGNLKLFVSDMTHYLTDLRYTRDRYLERKNNDEDIDECLGLDVEEVSVLNNSNLSTIDNSICEVKRILDLVSGHTSDAELDEKFGELEKRSHHESLCPELSQLHFQDSYSSSLQHSFMHESMGKLGGGLLRKKRGSFSDVDGDIFLPFNDEEPYRPKVIRTSSRKRFESSLRILQELCRWGAKAGLNRMRSIHQYFSRPLAVLELEGGEADLLPPSDTVLTIGRTLQLNLSHSLRRKESSSLQRCLSREDLSTLDTTHSSLGSDWSDSLLSVRSSCEPAFLLGGSYVKESNTSVVNGCVESQDSFSHNNPFFDSRCYDSLESDSASLTSSEGCPADVTDCRQVRVPLVSAAQHLFTFSDRQAGAGLLAFSRACPALLLHLLFSLLTSRPVVVVGDVISEQQVRAVVNSLWLFVPGHTRGLAVIPWHLRPLKLTDLAKFRLLGLGKHERRPYDKLVNVSIRKYLTIFDYDKKTLSAPEYQGGILCKLLKYEKSEEKLFISYVHSILFEYARYASLLHSAAPQQDDDSGISVRYDVETEENHLRKKLSLTHSDFAIVKNLRSLVQLQKPDDGIDQEAELVCPRIKLDNSPCAEFVQK